jgi:hypothetical protein
MPCDTPRRQQTIGERALEVRAAIAALDRALLRRQVRVVVGPQGAIAFTGWGAQERNGVTDACAYRRIMATGSTLAKLEIMKAEQLAGRSVDRSVVNAGTHSHDGGQTWNGRD